MAGHGWERWRQRVRPRLFLRRLSARLARPTYGRLPAAVVNGFPKGGTHLLVRCVAVLGGVQRQDFFLHYKTGEELNLPPVPAGGEGIPQGIGEPRLIPREGIERVLSSLWAGEFAVGHIPYSSGFEELLQGHRLRMLFILRDPRDAVISLLYFILSHPDSARQWHLTRTLHTPEEQVLAVISGFETTNERGRIRLRNIGDRLASVMPWLKVPLNYTTRFERLVGPQGGGSEEAQHEEIANIGRHAGLSLTPEQIREVATKLFGQGSMTFRRGQIGSWREHFNNEHKAAFKKIAGQYLIELGYERDLNW